MMIILYFNILIIITTNEIATVGTGENSKIININRSLRFWISNNYSQQLTYPLPPNWPLLKYG